MPEKLFPTTIAGFTEYIKIAYAKAQNNLSIYGVSSDKLAVITPLYNAYIAAEAVAANPDTATKGARRARNEARDALKPAWRKFLNESIRYNSAVPATDLEVFGIKERDTTRTPAGIPDKIPLVFAKPVGARRQKEKAAVRHRKLYLRSRYRSGTGTSARRRIPQAGLLVNLPSRC
jgi:hypothetical protein